MPLSSEWIDVPTSPSGGSNTVSLKRRTPGDNVEDHDEPRAQKRQKKVIKLSSGSISGLKSKLKTVQASKATLSLENLPFGVNVSMKAISNAEANMGDDRPGTTFPDLQLQSDNSSDGCSVMNTVTPEGVFSGPEDGFMDTNQEWNHAIPRPILDKATRVPSPSMPTTSSECPINWDSIRGVTEEQKEAYILRRPWNKKPNTLEYIKRNTLIFPVRTATEAYRKRLGQANKKIFRQTGIWFKNTIAGIETEKYGIKKRLEQIYEEEDGLATTDGFTEPFTRMVDIRQCVTIHLRDGTKRLILSDHAQANSVLFEKCISKQIPIKLNASREEFDRWASFFTPLVRSNFPLRTQHIEKLYSYKDELKCDEIRSVCEYKTETLPFTMGHVFRVYTLSIAMQNTDICDIILDQIKKLTNAEIANRLRYKHHFHKLLDKLGIVPILSFEPRDINDLWYNTLWSDPIKTMVLDMLSQEHIQDDAYEKIESNKDLYSLAFMSSWKTRLLKCTRYRISRLRQASGEVQPNHTHSDPLFNRLNKQEIYLAKETRRLQQLPPSTSGTDFLTDLDVEVRFERELLFADNKEISEQDQGDDYDEPFDLCQLSDSEVCRIYHHHVRTILRPNVNQLQSESQGHSTCYREKLESESQEPERIPASVPKLAEREVEITIGQVSGFIIENLTRGHLANTMCQRLVHDYADWDWRRLSGIYSGIDGKLLPIYWETGTADSFGRYPSHPGWNRSSVRDVTWRPSTRLTEDDLSFLSYIPDPDPIYGYGFEEDDEFEGWHAPGFGHHYEMVEDPSWIPEGTEEMTEKDREAVKEIIRSVDEGSQVKTIKVWHRWVEVFQDAQEKPSELFSLQHSTW